MGRLLSTRSQQISLLMVGNTSYLSQVLATGTDRRLVGEWVNKIER